ncbi:MAG: hypothetical protein ACFB9N_14530 [Geitlerinemataceae cyanobacterium]
MLPIAQLNSGRLLAVDGTRRNGLVICKRYHSEFAGPGAAVGGLLDVNVRRTIPIGDLALLPLEEFDERQKAYSIRRHWTRLVHRLNQSDMPHERARTLIEQFEQYFDASTVECLPDEALASLVGVLPNTMRLARSAMSS